jgi:hypothetical protein
MDFLTVTSLNSVGSIAILLMHVTKAFSYQRLFRYLGGEILADT